MLLTLHLILILFETLDCRCRLYQFVVIFPLWHNYLCNYFIYFPSTLYILYEILLFHCYVLCLAKLDNFTFITGFLEIWDFLYWYIFYIVLNIFEIFNKIMSLLFISKSLSLSQLFLFLLYKLTKILCG